MPQTKERHTEYMRDYRKQKKEDAIEEARKLAVRISQLIHARSRCQHQWEEMFKIIDSMGFILSRTDLTEHEKILRISEVPIPDDLAPYFRKLSKEIVT